MRVAASPLVRLSYPTLIKIPEPTGFVDMTIIHVEDWKPEYANRLRQLRYIVVSSLSQVDQLLEAVKYEPPDPSGDVRSRDVH